jgi:Flp pilus assembly protein TadB
MMIQQWFNVAGLCFDFIGVIMLAYEWWIALSAENKEAERAAMEQRLRPSPMFQQQQQANNPHQPMHDHMREQLRFQQQSARAQAVRGLRRSWFVTALVLIALGFLLQILGSIPGGLGERLAG